MLEALEGYVPIHDRIIASNEQLILAVNDAAIERERDFNRRFGTYVEIPRLRARDADATAGAIAVTAEQAVRDSLMLWLHGRFAVTQEGEELVLEGAIRTSWTSVNDIRFPISLRLKPERLTSYGSRLRPRSTVQLELLGTALEFAGEPVSLCGRAVRDLHPRRSAPPGGD